MLDNQSTEITFIENIESRYPYAGSRDRMSFAKYKCFCGNIFEAGKPRIKSKHIKSCGCLTSKVLIDRNTTHGLHGHILYDRWTNMKTRCYNKNNHNYANYGARGITICDRWLNSFENFVEDMYPTFDEELSLDRIDVNGNYEPSNCRWANKEVQARNCQKIRSNNRSGYKGVSFAEDRNKWTAQITVSFKHTIIGRFNTALEAAKAYDQYVINNNLEHTINGVL